MLEKESSVLSGAESKAAPLKTLGAEGVCSLALPAASKHCGKQKVGEAVLYYFSPFWFAQCLIWVQAGLEPMVLGLSL